MRRGYAGQAVFFVVLALAGVGCANYGLGTGAKLPFRAVYIAPVANRADLPQAEAIVSSAIRRAFLEDGRVVVVDTAAAADAVLNVDVDLYKREVATSRPGDTGLARTFALTLGVAATLHDNRSDHDLFTNRHILSQKEAYTDNGQLQAEYQTLPILAESLAKNVVHAALDVW